MSSSPSPSPSSPRVAGLAPGHPWQLGLGLVAWSVWFVVVYGGLSVGCAVAEPMPERRQFNAINGTLLLVTLALVLWLARASWTCARAARRTAGTRAGPAAARAHGGIDATATAAGAASPGEVPDDAATVHFIAHAAAWLYGIAAGAAVFVGAPMLALWPCI
jgi:hypothetical protein